MSQLKSTFHTVIDLQHSILLNEHVETGGNRLLCVLYFIATPHTERACSDSRTWLSTFCLLPCLMVGLRRQYIHKIIDKRTDVGILSKLKKMKKNNSSTMWMLTTCCGDNSVIPFRWAGPEC